MSQPFRYNAFGVCADAAEFMRIAETIGIDISERTAHRILSGTIAPLRSALSRLLRERDGNALRSNEVDLVKDRRGLKIAPDDLSRFSRDVERCFENLAQRYYLNMAGDPKIRVMKDRITFHSPLKRANSPCGLSAHALKSFHTQNMPP